MKDLVFLGIAGSLRKNSTNKGLLRCAQKVLPKEVSFSIADLSDIPFFNQDIEANKPESVKRVLSQIEQADALVFASTEYNYSLAPALKNILDWASRVENLLSGKPVAIMGSGGIMGTSRAQYHLRQSCVLLDLRPLNRPEIFVNAFANGTFNEAGDLLNKDSENFIKQLMTELVQSVKDRR